MRILQARQATQSPTSWVVYFLSLYRRLTQLGRDSTDRWLCMGGAAVAVGFLAGGIFEVNFYDSEVIMLVWMLLGILPLSAPGTVTPGGDKKTVE